MIVTREAIRFRRNSLLCLPTFNNQKYAMRAYLIVRYLPVFTGGIEEDGIDLDQVRARLGIPPRTT